MWILVIRPTAFTIAHPFDVVRRASVDCRVVGPEGEILCHPVILHDLPHRSAVFLVHAPVDLVVVGVDNHYVEGVEGGGSFFALADFAAAASEMVTVLSTVTMGGATAAGCPLLIAVMVMAATAQTRSPAGALVPTAVVMVAATKASCLACVIVSCMSLRAASGCGPSRSGEYSCG